MDTMVGIFKLNMFSTVEPESTFVEDVEGAVTGNEGEYYSKCDADPIGAWFYDAGAPQQHYVDADSPVETLV